MSNKPQFCQSNLVSHFNYFNLPESIPGTLNLSPNAPPPKITLIDYNQNQATKIELKNPLNCGAYVDTESVSWINIDGLGNKATWQQLSEVFQLHPVALEDIVNVPQRPKVVEYEEHLIFISRMITLDKLSQSFISEQISFILGKHYLLTIQEEPKYDCLSSVRNRIRSKKGIIRQKNVDYLFYALIDAIIDGFFPVMKVYGELVQSLQSEVISQPTNRSLAKIHQLQQDLLIMRRAIWPQRDAINSLLRDGSDLISDEVRVFLRDCYDHTIQILDMIETYRDLASNLTDIYLSSVSNRMNEIMKTLTVISSIFIPLTFIAGIYGMNFNPDKSPWNMPELNWYWGYPVILIIMLTVGVIMLLFFWRKGWFKDLNNLEKVNR
ncbi:magnesium/cobalt transporter CorA [Synechocystis sp. PCC 6714]|uniref:magnesium/cobalt transporter CorA n=1 Tax=Synechocystis sp. (strain PCC 6714) TaxID=1147 RepID=UPI0004D0B17E|nr:magnesium/cobalt transporter CorA [Synechocystis sp. PCC 6714]AIE76245.1 Magnesium and cobalt transport protein CorA [Synechocystis sp. PCC 6714]